MYVVQRNIKSIKMFFAPHFHVDKFETSMSGVGLKKVYNNNNKYKKISYIYVYINEWNEENYHQLYKIM